MFHHAVEAKEDGGFHLDLDDFLIGLLFMTNELVRFCVCVCVSWACNKNIERNSSYRKFPRTII